MRYLLLFLLFIPGMLAPVPVNDTAVYPKNYFRSPVDFRILLAGSFGEVRKNHFHSGIDIRTEGVEGKPVYAIADGYVSRINISSTGFGNALYLNHPNGYTSVYGHLQRYNSTIGAWIKAQQYKKESFEMDIPLEPGVLKVKKGDVIAFTGNSGASGGPHLHFEIRDAATQETINPLLFGFQVKDDVPPVISAIRIYPADENGLVDDRNSAEGFPVAGSDGAYTVKFKDPVTVSGNVYFGIHTWDLINDNSLKTGITSIELTIDTTRVFSQNLQRFAFPETRYVNSMVDYPLLVNSNQTILRSYIAPNNNLNVFSKTKNRGIVNFSDKKEHRVTYIVRDIVGNTSKLSFTVKSVPPVSGSVKKHKTIEGTLFTCRNENKFTNSDLTLVLPKEALYEDLDFHYSVSPAVKGSFSRVFHLQDEDTPIHTFCTLFIKPERMPKELSAKALIVKVDDKGGFSSRGGKWEDGALKTQIREFGNFTVAVDTTPPVIRPVNILPNKNIKAQGSIQVKVSDNLSGVKYYRGTINGKWILMSYDLKEHLLKYGCDDHLKPGKNEFRLLVRDDTGNESVYQASLIR